MIRAGGGGEPLAGEHRTERVEACLQRGGAAAMAQMRCHGGDRPVPVRSGDPRLQADVGKDFDLALESADQDQDAVPPACLEQLAAEK